MAALVGDLERRLERVLDRARECKCEARDAKIATMRLGLVGQVEADLRGVRELVGEHERAVSREKARRRKAVEREAHDAIAEAKAIVEGALARVARESTWTDALRPTMQGDKWEECFADRARPALHYAVNALCDEVDRQVRAVPFLGAAMGLVAGAARDTNKDERERRAYRESCVRVTIDNFFRGPKQRLVRRMEDYEASLVMAVQRYAEQQQALVDAGEDGELCALWEYEAQLEAILRRARSMLE